MKNSTIRQLVNPEGVPVTEQLRLNPHPNTLDGKTIVFRWNGKHNGDILLNALAELLTKTIQSARIIRGWEVAPDTVEHSFSTERSKEFARQLAAFEPDIVIGASGD